MHYSPPIPPCFPIDQLESYDSAYTNMKFDKPTSWKVYKERESAAKQLSRFSKKLFLIFFLIHEQNQGQSTDEEEINDEG